MVQKTIDNINSGHEVYFRVSRGRMIKQGGHIQCPYSSALTPFSLINSRCLKYSSF